MPLYDVEVWLTGGCYMADGYSAQIHAPDPEAAKARFLHDHAGVRGWSHFASGRNVTVREVEARQHAAAA